MCYVNLQEAVFRFMDVLIPDNYESLVMILKAPRPTSCNASSRQAWINASNSRTVVGLKKTIKITSLNTATVG